MQKMNASKSRPLPGSGKGKHRGKEYIAAGKNRITPAYDISIPEIIDLLNQGRISSNINSAADVIADAFYMGVEAGARLTEKRCKA